MPSDSHLTPLELDFLNLTMITVMLWICKNRIMWGTFGTSACFSSFAAEAWKWISLWVQTKWQILTLWMNKAFMDHGQVLHGTEGRMKSFCNLVSSWGKSPMIKVSETEVTVSTMLCHFPLKRFEKGFAEGTLSRVPPCFDLLIWGLTSCF